jgi:hypothetical protein
MSPHTFPSYYVSTSNITVVLERIVCWWEFTANGKPGTEIELDSGKIVKVGVSPGDVACAIKGAGKLTLGAACQGSTGVRRS